MRLGVETGGAKILAFGRALSADRVCPAARDLDFIAPPRLANAGLEGALLMAKTLENSA